MADEYLGAERRLVSVFRSRRKEGAYLFVDRAEGMARVPEALQSLFGTPQHVMDLLLTPQRQLAQADAAEVLRRIAEQGYHLQMPPLPDDEARAIILANDKLAAGRS